MSRKNPFVARNNVSRVVFIKNLSSQVKFLLYYKRCYIECVILVGRHTLNLEICVAEISKLTRPS